MTSLDLHIILDASIGIIAAKSLEYIVIKVASKIDSKLKTKLDVS